MSKVKFIQWGTPASPKSNTDRWASEGVNSETFQNLLDQYSGGIIFVTYTDTNNKQAQEIWANGVQYAVGGGDIDIEGTLNNVLVFGSGNTIADSGIAKSTITEGFTKNKVGAINATDINTLDKLRSKIAARNTIPGETGAPKDYTFDTFIKDLFQNVNGEVTEEGVVRPTITINKSTGDYSCTLEVGDTAVVSHSVTYSKGTFTQGSYYSHAVTNGESTDSYTVVSSGCTEGTWKIMAYNPSTEAYTDISGLDTNTNYVKTISTGHTYTISKATELSVPTTKTVTTGRYGINQTYTAATGWDKATTSYGNALFNSNPIPAGFCQDGPTADVTLSVSADFYHFVKGSAYLGAQTHTGTSAVVGKDDVVYIPNGWKWDLSWIVSDQTNKPASSHYTEETVYLELPSGGDVSKFTTTIPENKGYKTYKKITFNKNLPAFTSAESPSLNITKS